MHIEAGVVQGAKMLLSYGTAVGVLGMTAKLAWDSIKEYGVVSLLLKSLISIVVVFSCFELLPHYPVGVSEVHMILGTTIFLVFGIAPAMIGLAVGLLVQGLFFAPFDLPQYGINLTTLLASMLILQVAVQKIIPSGTAYRDIGYAQMLKLSLVWEGAIVGWVAFWALYGQGFATENIANILSFGGSYMLVVILEPLVDLAILAGVKTIGSDRCNILFDKRLNNCRA